MFRIMESQVDMKMDNSMEIGLLQGLVGFVM